MSNTMSIGPAGSTYVERPDFDEAGVAGLCRSAFVAGDALSQASILLVQAFRDERAEARQAAGFAELSRLREGEKRVHEMHQKADEMRAAGLVKGLATAAGGFLSGGSSILALGTQSDCVSQKLMGIGSGSAKVFEAVGGIVASRYDANAADCEANASAHESLGEAARTARDEATAQANDAKRSADTVTESLKDITAARNATLQAAIRA